MTKNPYKALCVAVLMQAKKDLAVTKKILRQTWVLFVEEQDIKKRKNLKHKIKTLISEKRGIEKFLRSEGIYKDLIYEHSRLKVFY